MHKCELSLEFVAIWDLSMPTSSFHSKSTNQNTPSLKRLWNRGSLSLRSYRRPRYLRLAASPPPEVRHSSGTLYMNLASRSFSNDCGQKRDFMQYTPSCKDRLRSVRIIWRVQWSWAMIGMAIEIANAPNAGDFSVFLQLQFDPFQLVWDQTLLLKRRLQRSWRFER